MSAAVWTDDDLSDITARRAAGQSWAEIAGAYGDEAERCKQRYSKARRSGRLSAVVQAVPLPDTRAARDAADAPPRPAEDAATGVVWEETPTSATVAAPYGRVRTLDELLAAGRVDMARWFVERWVLNSWEVGAKNADGGIDVEPLCQVKAWLKPVPGRDLGEALRESVLADMAAHAPRYAGVRYVGPRDGERHMLEVCPFDLHIGMLAWGPEAGVDYDSEIAERVLMNAVERILARASGYPIERILLPLGNDWLHADGTIAGSGGQTARGTPLDVDTRHTKMFTTGRRIAVALVDELRQTAPVEVVVVPGNHDEATAFYMGDVLDAWYRNDAHVTVDNGPQPRKYKTYGQTLLGFTHGHQAKHDKLPLLMATESPREWADTVYHEWHVGHLHRKGETITEDAGTRTRVIPSLAAEDSWHAGSGYRHQRALEAFVWHETEGLAAVLNAPARDPLARAA